MLFAQDIMATTLPKAFEAFAVPGGFKGQLSQLPLPDILQWLRTSHATGVLTLVSGGARKALYVKSGRVVFASSNLPNDRLGEILIREGKITVEEYDLSIKAISKGKRQGKALVEMGALSPKDLWEGIQFQVREIVFTHRERIDEHVAARADERIAVEIEVPRLVEARPTVEVGAMERFHRSRRSSTNPRAAAAPHDRVRFVPDAAVSASISSRDAIGLIRYAAHPAARSSLRR